MSALRRWIAGGPPRTAVRAAAAALLSWLVVLPMLGAGDSTLFTMTLMFTSVAVATNWNLTGGFTGYVDFGHAVWFGVGAYVTAIMMSLQANALGIGWPPVPAIVLGALVAGLLAALIGRATMRLRGPYFSIAMLGTFVAVREIVRTWGGLTGGGVGLTLPPYLNRSLFYYLELVLVVGLVALVWWLRRTRFGAALVAIRSDELGAEMRGIATTRLKVATFSFAGASTGLFGGLWGLPEHLRGPRHRLHRGPHHRRHHGHPPRRAGNGGRAGGGLGGAVLAARGAVGQPARLPPGRAGRAADPDRAVPAARHRWPVRPPQLVCAAPLAPKHP